MSLHISVRETLKRWLFPLGLALSLLAVALVGMGTLDPKLALAIFPASFLALLTVTEVLWGTTRPRLKTLPRDILFFALGAAFNALASTLAGLLALRLGNDGFGQAGAAPWWVALPVALLLADLVAWLVHRAFHSDLLWWHHKIHHAPDELYALMSTVNGPLMVVLVRTLPVLALVATGFPPVVLVGWTLIDAWIGLASHTGVSTFNPWLSRVLVTPEVHRIHHRTERIRNHGLTFTLWDRLFGTWERPQGDTSTLS